jgi:hypothetical protein
MRDSPCDRVKVMALLVVACFLVSKLHQEPQSSCLHSVRSSLLRQFIAAEFDALQELLVIPNFDFLQERTLHHEGMNIFCLFGKLVSCYPSCPPKRWISICMSWSRSLHGLGSYSRMYITASQTVTCWCFYRPHQLLNQLKMLSYICS